MFIFFILFVSKRDEAAENIIALIEPVALCVGADMRPVHGRIEDAALFGNDGKFFFPAQIISDVVILDKGLARMASTVMAMGVRLPRPKTFPDSLRRTSPDVRQLPRKLKT